MSLDHALLTLLYKRSARHAFLRGDTSSLGLTPEEIDAAQTIDADELESAAKLACQGLFERSNRGTGSLRDVFAKTIAAYRGSQDDLAMAFAESAPFDAYRALPTCEGGIAIEEAFFRFAEEAGIGDAATRTSELTHAMVRALAVTQSPSFSVPPHIRKAPQGWFAVLEAGPTLVATTHGRFVTGTLTPFLGDLLLARPEEREAVAKKHGASAVLAASLTELSQMGLV